MSFNLGTEHKLNCFVFLNFFQKFSLKLSVNKILNVINRFFHTIPIVIKQNFSQNNLHNIIYCFSDHSILQDHLSFIASLIIQFCKFNDSNVNSFSMILINVGSSTFYTIFSDANLPVSITSFFCTRVEANTPFRGHFSPANLRKQVSNIYFFYLCVGLCFDPGLCSR